MSHYASKLSAQKLEVSEDLIVHLLSLSLLHNTIILRTVITVKKRN